MVSAVYFVTGLYQLLKANFWVVELPSAWYTLIRVLYFPFSPYHNLIRGTLIESPISYEDYTYIMWGPLVAIFLVVFVAALIVPRARKDKR